MSERLRIAVISTPRSGNTWFRHLLASAYRTRMTSRHVMHEADWQNLPDEVVLQIHWLREADFEERLRREGFVVVALARHPLDVLISILHVAVHDVESESWLRGFEGDERGLWGAWPQSGAFLDYATSRRAAALLSVTSQWWSAPGVVQVRYEDLVANPAGLLRSLEARLGPARGSVEEAVEGASMERMKKSYTNNHFWMGRPGMWRELLTADRVEAIARAHTQVFETLGYSADARLDLTEDAASRRWIELTGAELGQTLRRNTTAFREQLAAMEAKARHAYEACGRLEAERDAMAQAASRLDRELADVHTKKAALHDEINRLHHEKIRLHAEITDSHDEKIRLHAEITDFHVQTEKLHQEIIALHAKCSGLYKEISTLRHSSGEMEEVIEAQRTLIEALEVKCKRSGPLSAIPRRVSGTLRRLRRESTHAGS
jgi:predicted  nucleic acid-binding Zn-ribbon protein